MTLTIAVSLTETRLKFIQYVTMNQAFTVLLLDSVADTSAEEALVRLTSTINQMKLPKVITEQLT